MSIVVGILYLVATVFLFSVAYRMISRMNRLHRREVADRIEAERKERARHKAETEEREKRLDAMYERVMKMLGKGEKS